MKTRVAILIAAALVLCACTGGRPGGGNNSSGHRGAGKANAGKAAAEASSHRPFPAVSVPSVYGSETVEAQDYVLQHYWDGFFKGDWKTTPDAILGVKDEDVEQNLANYIQVLNLMKLASTPDDMSRFRAAQASVSHLFSQLEARQLADTSAKTYLRFTEVVAKYLYDPNSPMRDEDFYLPFVKAMAASPCTRDNMRAAYRYEASQCAKNGFGQRVPDFSYKDGAGRRGSLYSIRADYTMLFFSNPGCQSCKEIIDDIKSCACIRPLMETGRLAIINIYIDEEVQKWRDYLPNYPREWINGYDYLFVLRNGGGYDIRAIPSLYLLDGGKRVLMKDAPTESVLTYLENIYKQ